MFSVVNNKDIVPRLNAKCKPVGAAIFFVLLRPFYKSCHKRHKKRGNDVIKDAYLHMSSQRGDPLQCAFFDIDYIIKNRAHFSLYAL